MEEKDIKKIKTGGAGIDSFVFKDFLEYYHYARHLTATQKENLFSSLSRREKKSLEDCFKVDGWEDLVMRNALDKKADEIKKKYDIDMIGVRGRVLKNKTVYMDKKLWNIIKIEFKDFSSKHTNYLIGNIDHFNVNEDTVLLYRKGSNIDRDKV